MNCMSVQSKKLNLRNRVHPSLSSTVLQGVCESSWQRNLRLRESETGIVALFEEHYKAIIDFYYSVKFSFLNLFMHVLS